jgi:predicted nucleic acid-binding protein
MYMDNCCFNRPFDDKKVFRNRLEADAKLQVQRKMLVGELDLVWSFILDLENDENPYEEIRTQIFLWRDIAKINIAWNPEILVSGKKLQRDFSIRPKDALHLACALTAQAGYFLTTDRKFLARIRILESIRCINPVEWIEGEDT